MGHGFSGGGSYGNKSQQTTTLFLVLFLGFNSQVSVKKYNTQRYKTQLSSLTILNLVLNRDRGVYLKTNPVD